jgi:hypothetical protein
MVSVPEEGHMNKLRKQTDRLVRELIALRKSRKSLDDFFYSQLINFYENCRLMHFFLGKYKYNHDLFQIAYRQYFVFLVSCWETFFRDMFVYVYTRDSEAMGRLLEYLKINDHAGVSEEITLSELLSKHFNFQKFSDLEMAYNSMWEDNFMKSICTTDIGPCGANGKMFKHFCIAAVFDDWHSVIERTFSTRHSVVHDANYRPPVDLEFIQRAESVFLIVPQFATHLIAKKYNLARIAFTDGSSRGPYIFSVEDILSNDWQLRL